jgi:hypothetical protein
VSSESEGESEGKGTRAKLCCCCLGARRDEAGEGGRGRGPPDRMSRARGPFERGRQAPALGGAGEGQPNLRCRQHRKTGWSKEAGGREAAQPSSGVEVRRARTAEVLRSRAWPRPRSTARLPTNRPGEARLRHRRPDSGCSLHRRPGLACLRTVEPVILASRVFKSVLPATLFLSGRGLRSGSRRSARARRPVSFTGRASPAVDHEVIQRRLGGGS